MINSGTSDATNVTVTDTVDSNLINLSADGDGPSVAIVIGNDVTWTVPTLAAGASIDLMGSAPTKPMKAAPSASTTRGSVIAHGDSCGLGPSRGPSSSSS